MGLFGGFRAKFTRNSTTKAKPQEVVCLKYHIHSEFDAPEASFSVANNIKKNEVVKRNSKTKARKALAKSAIFPDSSDTSNTTLSSPVVQKSQSLVNLNGHASENEDHPESITVAATIEVPGNSRSTVVSDTTFGRKTEEHNGVVAETVAVVTNNHMVTTNNHVKTEKREKTILKTFSAYAEPDHDQADKSTLIFMTQHSSEVTEKDAENGEDNFDINFSNRAFKMPITSFRQDSIEEEDYADRNFNINATSKSFDEDNFNINATSKSYDEDDFRVNVVQHDYNRSYSYSEDEKSYQEEEPLEFTKMGFSSQAASIFFGQDIEPVQPRPRRILLKKEDEDDRRSSGADC